MTEATSGLGLALIALFAGAGGPLWGRKLDTLDMRKVCSLGLFLEAIAIFLIGPAKPLPGTLWIMVPGLALLGVGVSAVQVTTLRTLNLYVTEDVIKMMKDAGKTVRPENLTGVADKASALFNICLAVGNIIAPILGGALVDGVGFPVAADIMSSVLMCNFVFFVLMNFVFLPKPEAPTVLPDASEIPAEDEMTLDPSKRALTGATPMQMSKDYANIRLAQPMGHS